VFWVVAKVRTLDSRGVYPSWEVCHPRVHGVHNSVIGEFNTEHDVWQYSLKGQAGGPYHSIGQKGKVFGINIHNLKAWEDLCVPSPETMPIQVKKQLGEQMLDMPSFPRAVTMSESENAETQAHIARTLASIAGKESDLAMGEGGMDAQWQNTSRTTMLKIKDRNSLRERLKDLKETAEHLPHNLESNISNVLVMAGYNEDLARDWALVFLILRMSLKGVDFYINLHSHILDVSTENAGDWESPALELEFHGSNLKMIRISYNNRLQVMCSFYAYL
jgi:hypothetical protein